MAIEQTGAATAQEFMATLPQNFGGGRSDDGLEGPVASDNVFGSALNLRGLGSGTTLVLVNGRRRALSGGLEYVDVSMIPLSAVERIEVLTDGASAMYGADAIGGVVNFVMRKNYSGAETRVRGGWTSGGGGEERQASQTLGAAWSSGSVLLSYEYYDREKITALQREATEGLNRNNSIVPPQEKQSVLISATQELAPSLTLMADGQFSKRSALGETFQDELAEEANTLDSDNEEFGGSLGINYSLAESWNVELVAGLNHTLNDALIFAPTSPSINSHQTRESEMRHADATLTGDLIQLPAGPLKLALGGSYREESYKAQSVNLATAVVRPQTNDEFDLKAAFAELQLPLLADGTRPVVTVSVAGRYEEYSNFGSSTSPKFGVLFAPTEELRLRGTYGKSFKAPTLIQMDTITNGTITAANVATPSGTVRLLRMGGNNAGLDAETATTWTGGVDFTLDSAGFSAHATYFSIDYEKRIEAIIAPQPLQLADPAFAGTRTLRTDMSDAEFNELVSALLANPNGLSFISCRGRAPNRNPCDEPATNFAAILDRRLRNLAVTEDTGLDVILSQRFDTAAGRFDLGLNATYLFDYTRQFTDAAPSIDLIDTVFLPVDFRMRANVGFTRDAWTMTTWINRTDNYTDTGVTPFARVDSWTTVDMNLRYEPGKSAESRWLEDVSIVLNVNNLFDKRPPHLERPGQIEYDVSNADPYGRLMSLTLQKSW